MFILLNTLIPSWGLETINGVQQKNIDWIVDTTVLLGIIPGLLIPLFLKVLAMNLASSNNAWRMNEALLLHEGILRYSYRIKYQQRGEERYLFTIPMDQIEEVKYNPKTEELCFCGNFLHEYYSDFQNETSDGEVSTNTVKIHDYFTPSLKREMRKRGVKIVGQV